MEKKKVKADIFKEIWAASGGPGPARLLSRQVCQEPLLRQPDQPLSWLAVQESPGSHRPPVAARRDVLTWNLLVSCVYLCFLRVCFYFLTYKRNSRNHCCWPGLITSICNLLLILVLMLMLAVGFGCPRSLRLTSTFTNYQFSLSLARRNGRFLKNELTFTFILMSIISLVWFHIVWAVKRDSFFFVVISTFIHILEFLILDGDFFFFNMETVSWRNGVFSPRSPVTQRFSSRWPTPRLVKWCTLTVWMDEREWL